MWFPSRFVVQDPTIKMAPRKSPPTVRLFLAKREEDGRKFENVQGEERKKLKKDLWPFLRPSLPAKYGNQNVPQYDEYITEILAQNRKITIQPNKTVTAHIANDRQEMRLDSLWPTSALRTSKSTYC
jgi:hypothetical protein